MFTFHWRTSHILFISPRNCVYPICNEFITKDQPPPPTPPFMTRSLLYCFYMVLRLGVEINCEVLQDLNECVGVARKNIVNM